MKRRPAGQQHDFDRHDRDRPPRYLTKQCQGDAGEHVAALGPASRQYSRTGARHMRRVDRVASRLECEIGFDRAADIEIPAMKQRPPAVRSLRRAEIPRDTSLELRLDAVEVVLQQYIFGGYRRVGLELENPVAVGVL